MRSINFPKINAQCITAAAAFFLIGYIFSNFFFNTNLPETAWQLLQQRNLQPQNLVVFGLASLLLFFGFYRIWRKQSYAGLFVLLGAILILLGDVVSRFYIQSNLSAFFNDALNLSLGLILAVKLGDDLSEKKFSYTQRRGFYLILFYLVVIIFTLLLFVPPQDFLPHLPLTEAQMQALDQLDQTPLASIVMLQVAMIPIMGVIGILLLFRLKSARFLILALLLTPLIDLFIIDASNGTVALLCDLLSITIGFLIGLVWHPLFASYLYPQSKREKYDIFQAFFMSFYSKKLYICAANRWRSFGIGYSFLLSIFLLILVTYESLIELFVFGVNQLYNINIALYLLGIALVIFIVIWGIIGLIFAFYFRPFKSSVERQILHGHGFRQLTFAGRLRLSSIIITPAIVCTGILALFISNIFILIGVFLALGWVYAYYINKVLIKHPAVK